MYVVLHGRYTAQFQKDLEQAHENIALAQQQQAGQYDLKHSHEVFKVGDYVLLLRSGINYMPSVSNSPILLSPYIGPFMISAVDLERDNYTLALPTTMRCHKIFHVRCLKRYVSPFRSFPSRIVVESTPPEIVENGAPEFEVHDILDTQLVNGTRMFLVSWIGYDHSHDSWEPLENLENCGELVLEYLKGVGPEKLVDRD